MGDFRGNGFLANTPDSLLFMFLIHHRSDMVKARKFSLEGLLSNLLHDDMGVNKRNRQGNA